MNTVGGSDLTAFGQAVGGAIAANMPPAPPAPDIAGAFRDAAAVIVAAMPKPEAVVIKNIVKPTPVEVAVAAAQVTVESPITVEAVRPVRMRTDLIYDEMGRVVGKVETPKA